MPTGEGEERARRCHERVRDSLPAVEYGTCAGVRVPRPAEPRKPLDRLLGRDTPEHSPFEGALASVHREHTRAGDRAVVVGGGFGITTVAAAEAGARVTVYEASADRLAALRGTLDLNGVDAGQVTLRQAVVGELAAAEAEEKGLDPDLPAVDPADVLPCDVLELDCEGAERAVLRGLSDAPDASLPRLVAVEVHPIKLGERPAAVLDLLSGLGYEPVEWLTHDGATISREQFEGLLDGETPDVTGEDHQEFPPVVVAER
ncbi:MAG: FkbM family methyltransferase [Haloarculaceae archaeon]